MTATHSVPDMQIVFFVKNILLSFKIQIQFLLPAFPSPGQLMNFV